MASREVVWSGPGTLLKWKYFDVSWGHPHTYTTCYHFYMLLLPPMPGACSSLWGTHLGYRSYFTHVHREPKLPATLQSPPTEMSEPSSNRCMQWKPTCHLHPQTPLWNCTAAGIWLTSHPCLDSPSCHVYYILPHFWTWKPFVNQSVAHKPSPQCPFLGNQT